MLRSRTAEKSENDFHLFREAEKKVVYGQRLCVCGGECLRLSGNVPECCNASATVDDEPKAAVLQIESLVIKLSNRKKVKHRISI